MEIAGKVALVTGGARRVGRALALGLARAGSDVVIHYHRSAGEARAVAEEVAALGRQAITVAGDVSDETDISRIVAAARERFGRLDILVNSASRFDSASLLEITRDEWDRVLAVNLTGPFLLSQAAAPLLQADGGGVIVNIADLSAFQPWPSHAHHAVSKAGLVHLTRVLARALAPAVRAVAVAPGTVLPPDDDTPEQVRSAAERAVLGRIGSPEDVVRAVVFLVESDFITGATIVVDGGRLLRW